MSFGIKIIGIIIMVFGFIAVMGTMYTASSEVPELSLEEALSIDRFWSYMIKYVVQSIIVVIGLSVYLIGVKLEPHHS